MQGRQGDPLLGTAADPAYRRGDKSGANQRVGDLLAQEIATTMQLLGRTTVADLGPDCLRLRG